LNYLFILGVVKNYFMLYIKNNDSLGDNHLSSEQRAASSEQRAASSEQRAGSLESICALSHCQFVLCFVVWYNAFQ
jgi:hypothetical protein